MPLSPLTLSVTDKSIPKTDFHEDSSGLWFRNTGPTPNPEVQCRPSNTAELEADQRLSKVLFEKYMGGKPGRVLDVMSQTPSLVQYFQSYGCTDASPDPQTLKVDRLDMVTFVHTFQLLSVDQARRMLNFLANNMSPDGVLFIRMPDHDVEGFERDLNPENKMQCFWDLSSFLELLSQVKRFRITETYTIKPGQRDYFLKVFDAAPSICAGLIVKNEERDLPKCLDSLRGVIDGIVIMDTGSTDNTIQIAQQWVKKQNFQKPSLIRQYLEASEKDESGDWKLWDFGKARNAYVEEIERLGVYDYILWMDADDIALDPMKLKNLVYLQYIDMHGIQMNSGDLKWIHHRLWKTKKNVRYSGRCHEYPAFGGLNSTEWNDIRIFHDGAAGVGENANKRNLRILEREVAEAPTPRNCFYLGNTHKDGGRFLDAVTGYDKRIAFGKGYEDEYWFAVLYKGRCLRLGGKLEEARRILTNATVDKPNWAEFWMELAYLESTAGDHRKALGYATIAQDMPIPPTSLFRENNKYTDQPYRSASFAAENLKDLPLALHYALIARDRIGGPDKDWDKRIADLEGRAGKKL